VKVTGEIVILANLSAERTVDHNGNDGYSIEVQTSTTTLKGRVLGDSLYYQNGTSGKDTNVLFWAAKGMAETNWEENTIWATPQSQVWNWLSA